MKTPNISIMNFGEMGLALISGTLVLFLGYHRFFLYAAWVVGPALLVMYFIKEKTRFEKTILNIINSTIGF